MKMSDPAGILNTTQDGALFICRTPATDCVAAPEQGHHKFKGQAEQGEHEVRSI